MAKPTPTYYILHGEDLFTLEEEVAAMRARMGADPATADLNTTTFDGKTATLADVLNAVSALPFLSDRRLAIVNGWLSYLAQTSGGKATLEALVAQLPGLPDWARLVFVERETLSENHPVLRLARSDPRGYVKAFRRPALNEVGPWIQARAAHYGVSIEAEARDALVALVRGDQFSADLTKADNELFKLAAYVGEGGVITRDHIAAVTAYVPEESVFPMVDALGRRDGPTATRLLLRLLKDTDALNLFSLIIRQFRLLLQAREHLESGGGRGPALARALRVQNFVAAKLEEQSRRFTLDGLEQTYRHLLDLDRRIKTGQIAPELALAMLVAGLCD